MKKIFIILVLFVRNLSAQSQFTIEEVPEVLKLRGAIDDGLKVAQSCGGTANAPGCQAFLNGLYDLGVGTGWVLGVDVHANDGASFLMGPRADVLAAAFSSLTTANFKWCGTLSLTAPCVGGASTTFGTNIFFTSAVSKLRGFNRTLTYSNPYPANIPDQFGPHGDYGPAQKALWRSFRYELRAVNDGWVGKIPSNVVPPCPGIFTGFVGFARRVIVDTWFLSAMLVSAENGYELFQNTYLEVCAPHPASPSCNENIKRALTEYALINGPTDTGTQHAAQSLAVMAQAANTCMAGSSLPMSGAALFVSQLGDGWDDMDAWTGHFSAIKP